MKKALIFLLMTCMGGIAMAQDELIDLSYMCSPEDHYLFNKAISSALSIKELSYRKKNMNMQESTAATLAAVERFNEAFNRHDADAVMAAMTDDCIFENTNPAPDGKRYTGAAEVRAYWERFFAANPDAKFEAEEIFAYADRCVVRWIYRKTKDGKPWHLRGVDVFRVRDGKVAEKLSYVKG